MGQKKAGSPPGGGELAQKVENGVEHRVKEESEGADHNDHFEGHDEKDADGPEGGNLFAEF